MPAGRWRERFRFRFLALLPGDSRWPCGRSKWLFSRFGPSGDKTPKENADLMSCLKARPARLKSFSTTYETATHEAFGPYTFWSFSSACLDFLTAFGLSRPRSVLFR